MKTCGKSPFLPLKLIYITLLPVLEAQGVNVWPEVTGYLGHDVTLPCQLIAAKENANITQVQWDLLQPEGKSITIIVFSRQFGVNIHESSLKERLEITEQLLLIKNVEMRDAGSYTCTIATFPLGSFEGKTNLVVREQTELIQILPRMIATAIFVLIIVTMAVTTYVIIIRIRRDSSVKHRVCTASPVICD